MKHAAQPINASLSRKLQDFHEADPGVQAALNGEEYFDVTPGHLLSSALELKKPDGEDYFANVDQALGYFGLERAVLKRREPFTQHEIDDLEDAVHTRIQDRLLPAEDAKYESWAEAVIANMTIPEEQRDATVNILLEKASSNEPSKKSSDYSDELENKYNESEFHVGHMGIQMLRLVNHIHDEGFAITLDMALKSLIDNGLIQEEETVRDWFTERVERNDSETMREKLASAAFAGASSEMRAGLIDAEIFTHDGEVDIESKRMNDRDFHFWDHEGHPIILSAKDLRLFASNYASEHELPAVEKDPEFQTLVGLFKNTPERITEIKSRVTFLTDGPSAMAAVAFNGETAKIPANR